MHIFSPWKQIKTDGQHIITGEEQISSGEEQEISARRQIFADEEEKISARCGKSLSLSGKFPLETWNTLMGIIRFPLDSR